MDVHFLIGRVVCGGFFLFNRINHVIKLQMMTAYAASQRVPFPRAMVLVTGVMLVAGGASMLLGSWLAPGLPRSPAGSPDR